MGLIFLKLYPSGFPYTIHSMSHTDILVFSRNKVKITFSILAIPDSVNKLSKLRAALCGQCLYPCISSVLPAMCQENEQRLKEVDGSGRLFG